MSRTELFERALRLSEKQRRELAGRLWESLKGEPADPDWRAAWTDELERRSAAYERGEMKAEDAFEALERLRKSLLKKRKT